MQSIFGRRDAGQGGNRINRVSGIINGTTNYILTRMADEGAAYADVLAEAQRLGYAEADPAADVDGLDAADKGDGLCCGCRTARTTDVGVGCIIAGSSCGH